MRFLILGEVLELHDRLITETGGASGLRDLGGLESALAQPRMSFGGEDLYPTVAEKAAALTFSLVSNHPFVDGNKRIGHAAMEAFLMLNGHEITAAIDESEHVMLRLAAGEMSREELVAWVGAHLVRVDPAL